MTCKTMEDMISEAIINRDKEIIAMLLQKGDTPKQIHEKLEFPMDLIIRIQDELIAPAKTRHIGDFVSHKELPKVSIDTNGLCRYIRDNDLDPEKLHDSDVEKFITGDDDWKQFRDSFTLGDGEPKESHE